MKKLFFIFVMLLGSIEAFSQAATLLPVQANNPIGIMPPNLLWVDPVTYRIWPVKSDSLKMGYQSVRWLNDSVIVIGDRRWVKLAGSYPNPNFISSLSSSKVTGLSTVATSGDYNDLSNKPNLSAYETTSHAASTFYPLTGNPSNFLTSFTEVDPTIPGYSKSLTDFTVIKSSTDPLYRPITYAPSSADIISGLGFTPYNSTNPAGYISSVPSQSFASLTGKPITLLGYGITDAYPLTGNPGGFLTGITSGQILTALGYTPVAAARTLTINGATFDLSANRSWTVGDVTSASLSSTLSSYVLATTYTAGLAAKQNTISVTTTGSGAATLVGSTLNIPTPVINTYTAGSGVSIVSNVIANTAPDQTVTLTAGNKISITGTYPNFTISYVEPTTNIVNRSLNSNFTISTTKQALAIYTVTCQVTNPLLVGTSSATAYLEYSINGGSTWLLPSQNGNSSGVGITVTLQLTNGQTGTLIGYIPANALTRVRTVTAGTGSVIYVTGQETY